ncbi:hemolysin XhlA [Clostridium sp.]|uniref:hemolysin XhlA n=1 Tax=Clostridium sp. TaxID=1506 RepID=UPI002FC64D1C
MSEIEVIQEIRERLIRIESKIENTTEKYLTLEKRVTKIEDNNTWISRAIVGQVIAAIMAFFLLKK